MTQAAKNSNVVFFENDSPQAVESLKNALANAGDAPLLGLVLKVEVDPKGEDQVVNWMFADTSFIKSLVLILPGKKSKK
ncbi:MAG: hypothetical protein Q7T89_18040 [Anaerolineales bacterium]|nr:hypothetical protein [Anaerolineales bacterium]